MSKHPERIYYKSVPVRVVSIQQQIFKTSRSFLVSVRNDEYNLETSVVVDMYSNNRLYYDLVDGKVKVGYEIQMLMYSTVNEYGKVVKRYLDNRFIY